MNLSPNTLLQDGKYRIIRFISSGGFGCTYEAEHVMLEKHVAINHCGYVEQDCTGICCIKNLPILTDF